MRYNWVCGISVETDTSEDSPVHCIKPGSKATDAAAAISTETATLLRDVNKDDVDTIPLPVMKNSRTTKLLFCR